MGCALLQEDKCYPVKVCEEFTNLNILTPTQETLALMQGFYSGLAKNSDAEKFYQKYFSIVPMQAEQLFPMLTKNAAMLLVLKLAELMIQDVKKTKFNPIILDSSNVKELTQKEIDCLQYLGGYVIHTLYRKVRGHKNWATSTKESQQMMSILLSAKKDDTSGQNFVNEVNRISNLTFCFNTAGLRKSFNTHQI